MRSSIGSRAGDLGEKAERFLNMQLRSVLDERGAPPDPTWQSVLDSELLIDQADVDIELLLPANGGEQEFLTAVESLTASLGAPSVTAPGDGLATYFLSFGWKSAREYFDHMGDTQVMVIDLDYNDSDDRLAIVLLAYQMASANVERRASNPGAQCTLLLDTRSYERTQGVCTYRTLRLAAVLRSQLHACGLVVDVVLGNAEAAIAEAARYLNVADAPNVVAALARKVPDDPNVTSSRPHLRESCGDGVAISVWILASVSAAFVDDLEFLRRQRRVRVTMFEQAQPAWQSEVLPPRATVQPVWSYPPDPEDNHGFGAEPSNVRRGESEYDETICTYLRLQRALAEPGAPCCCVAPAVARRSGWLPTPPGAPMLGVSGRTLLMQTGQTYTIKKALDRARAEAAFAALLAAAPDGLKQELYTGTCDDCGAEMTELGHIRTHGTTMADCLCVVVGARSPAALAAISQPKRRRLLFALASSL